MPLDEALEATLQPDHELDRLSFGEALGDVGRDPASVETGPGIEGPFL
jgi:hypothetical protein